MKFLILLIALGVERYLNISYILHRFKWFQCYLDFGSKYLRSRGLWQGFVGVAFVVLPILIVVTFLYYWVAHLFYGVAGFILALFIFIYCLGPRDMYAELERYFKHESEEDAEKAEHAVKDLIIDNKTPGISFNRKLSQGMLWHFNDRIFAVSFWFVILGPCGALLYRLVSLLCNAADKPQSKENEMSYASHLSLDILDWVPTRLASLGYALMGNFTKGFAYWIQHCLSGLDKNREIAIRSGFAALEIDLEHENDIEENKAVLGLLDRTSIMYLVVVAIFTLGALAY